MIAGDKMGVTLFQPVHQGKDRRYWASRIKRKRRASSRVFIFFINFEIQNTWGTDGVLGRN